MRRGIGLQRDDGVPRRRRPRCERTQVYGYEVVDLHAWEKAEGETNAFAAPGRSGAMVIPQDVLELRAARVKTKARRDK